MEYGSMSIQRLQSGRWLNWGIRFFLTAALTASQTAGGYAPFALGCIAAAGPGADGAAALLGGVTGALLFLDFQQVLALAAVGILILTAATAFRDTAFLQKPWVLPVLAAGMVLAVGGIYVLQSLDPLSHAAPCAAASALTGVSAHFFTRLFQPEEDRLAPEGLLFLGAALTLALGDLTILNVSVGRVLLCALLAYTAYDQGPMTGVTAGLGLGLITDLSAGTSGLFTAAYGVAGLCAAKCRRRSMAALAFFSGAAAAMLTSREELAQTLLLETVAGSLLFLALPRRIFGGKRLLREAAPDTAQRTALKTHLNRAAEALRELYDSMSRTPPPQEENPAVIFDRAAEKVCRGCALCELCWQKDYTATFNALNDATPYLLERGKAKAKDFPVHFADRCIHLSELLQAINGELSAFLLRKQYRRQLEETRRSAKGQYAQMSDLLSAAAVSVSGAAPALEEMARLRHRRGAAAQGGGTGLRRHHGSFPHGRRPLVPDFGGRNGQWRRRPAGIRPDLPAAAAVFRGGHSAGGGPDHPELRYGPPGCGDRQLYHGGSVRFERLGGHLLQVRCRPQLSQKERRRPPDHRQQPAGGTAGHSCRTGYNHRDAGARQLRRDGQRRCGRPQPGRMAPRPAGRLGRRRSADAGQSDSLGKHPPGTAAG